MPEEEKIKELANKLLSNGLATTMMDAMEKASDILTVEEKERNKKGIINKPNIEPEQQKEDSNENSGNDDEEYDISKEKKTVKELMEEFSE